MMSEHEGALPSLPNLVMDVAVAKPLGITRLDDPALYISTEKSVLLMNQAD